MYQFGENDKLDDFLEKNRMVLLEFGSSLCMPCGSLKEKIENREKDWDDVECVYISFDSEKKLAADFGVFAVPTVLFYVDGKLTIRESGYFSMDSIFERIERYRELLK